MLPIQVFLFFIFFAITFPQYVGAHILRTDRTISALLHVDPDDTPVAHMQSVLSFEFEDKTNQFSINNCNCILAIKNNGHTIYAQKLSPNNTSSTHLVGTNALYTFPQIGVYDVTLVGTPKTQDAFQPFTLSFFLRVTTDNRSFTINTPTQTNPASLTFEQRMIDIIVAVLGLGSIIMLLGSLRAIQVKLPQLPLRRWRK